MRKMKTRGLDILGLVLIPLPPNGQTNAGVYYVVAPFCVPYLFVFTLGGRDSDILAMIGK